MNILDYRIIKDLNLVIEVVNGKLQLDEYIDLKLRIVNDRLYDANICNKFIIDFRNAVITEKGDQIRISTRKYLEKLRTIPNLNPSRKGALITRTPDQVVATMLYRMINDLPVTLEIFASISAACSWLNLDQESVKATEIIISEMKEDVKKIPSFNIPNQDYFNLNF